jgi:hypothetical protein
VRDFGGEMGRDRETEPKITHRTGVATRYVFSNAHAKTKRWLAESRWVLNQAKSIV